MAGITVSDEAHDEIERMSHVLYTTKKDIAERMVAFVSEREKVFFEVMF